MKSHYKIIQLVLLFFLIGSSEAVKEYLFKTCEKSSFCHRNRHFANEVRDSQEFDSRYSVDPASIKGDLIHSTFKGDILKKLNDGSNVHLPFELNVLKDNNIRLRIDEQKRIDGDIDVENSRLTKRRFNEAYKYALKNSGKDLRLLDDEVELKFEKFDDSMVINYGADLEYQVELQYAPFKLTQSLDNNVVLALNDENLLNFEHWRPNLENDTVNLSPQETDFNMFKDDFKDSKNDKMPFGPESVGVDIAFVEMDHVFGLSEHASQELELQDTSEQDPYRLFNVDIFEYETESKLPMYGSVPFILGVSKDYSAGIFWINGADTYIDIRKSKYVLSDENQQILNANGKKTSTHWISENGILDVILIVDKKPELVNKKYGDLVGNAEIPALFSLGYHQCRWNYNDELDVLDIHSKFDHYNISYDSIWLDIEYTDSKKYFTWKKELFPDPMKMLSALNETGRNLIAIIDPHIKTGYEISDHLESESLAITNSDNDKSYHGHCWPGESVWIDTFNPQSVAYWETLFVNSISNEFMGDSDNLYLWNDMNEPSVFNGPETSAPKDLVHYGGWEHRSVHNIYGLTFHEATYEALVKRNSDKRPFILTRSFYTGSQRTTAMWTGDNMSKWEYLKVSIPMNMNQGIVNYIFSGSDVGGFFGNPSKELLTRWYQTGIWYPFFRGHAHIDSRRREPWVAGEPYTSIMRDVIDLRYKLLPAFYTAFYENSITGLPFMKPMFYESPQSEDAYHINDQFFISDTGLLVKPITDEVCESTTVYFPDDEHYYDFYTHELVSSSTQHYEVRDIELSTLPIYLKGGHILPTKERHRRSSRLQKFDPYTLTVVLDKHGSATGKLYIDDGESFQYQNGEFVVVEFKYEQRELSAIVNSKSQNFINTLDSITIEKIIIVGAYTDISKADISQDGASAKIDLIIDGSDLVIRRPNLTINKNWSIKLH